MNLLKAYRKTLITAIVLTSVAVGSRTLAAERTAKVLHQYSLPPYSLENLGYSAEELSAAQANGLPAIDLPAIGSGLQSLGGSYYLGVSDRGPTFTRTTPTPGRVFPLSGYTPMIVFFKAAGGEIQPDAFLPIVVDDAGAPATGVSNSATEDSVPFESPSATVQLPFNPNGLDVEDIHMFRDGRFLVVDEYSPSIAVLNENGKVLKRYTPKGKTLAGASYGVSDVLPAILSQRRANRGFEAIAVTQDEQTAYVMTQSPLGPTSAGSSTRNSRVIRVLRLDTADLLNIQVTGQFVVLMSPATDYPAGNRPQDLKISAARAVSDQQLLLIERSDEVGIGGAKLILVDLSAATDVSDLSEAQSLALENSSLDLTTIGVIPAGSTVVFRNEEAPELTDFKLEGLSILNRNVVAISNDNDFGVEGPAHFQLWVIQLAEQLP